LSDNAPQLPLGCACIWPVIFPCKNRPTDWY
jgi:hypothetical protein